MRSASARNDDDVDGAQRGAGQLETDTSDAGPAVQQDVTALVDEGQRGAVLERLCSELDENATPRAFLDCLDGYVGCVVRRRASSSTAVRGGRCTLITSRRGSVNGYDTSPR